MSRPVDLPRLPEAPVGVPWPKPDWQVAEPGAHVDRNTLDRLVEDAFGPKPDARLGDTFAALVIQQGRLVFERYGAEKSGSSTFHSWSMAKSITHALTGLMVKDGLLDIYAPANVPEWQTANDPRAAITLDQLLRMSSGLEFNEDYVDGATSDTIEMLWGAGKADTARFAAEKPLEHAPDTVCSYSSGTTNIICRHLAQTLGKNGLEFEAWMRARLFYPIGMATPVPKFDDAGTFIGSSFCFCSAQDFARFGLLYLRDGVCDDVPLLPEGWVDYARTPTPDQPDELLGYGAHWWLGLAGEGSFSANGYDGQRLLIVPKDDLVIVRLGQSPLEEAERLNDWVAELADAFQLDG
ncbi:MAG: serine hydrolase [Pseudomonadota bacterium]